MTFFIALPASQAVAGAVLLVHALGDQVGHQLLELAADQRHLDLDLDVEGLGGARRRTRRASSVPLIEVGLPGVSIEIVPPAGELHSSVWTARVVSPANFFANAGTPSVGCTWSICTLIPSPCRLIVTSAEITPMASAEAWRKAGSASIAKTSASGRVVGDLVAELHGGIMLHAASARTGGPSHRLAP